MSHDKGIEGVGEKHREGRTFLGSLGSRPSSGVKGKKEKKKERPSRGEAVFINLFVGGQEGSRGATATACCCRGRR